MDPGTATAGEDLGSAAWAGWALLGWTDSKERFGETEAAESRREPRLQAELLGEQVWDLFEGKTPAESRQRQLPAQRQL